MKTQTRTMWWILPLVACAGGPAGGDGADTGTGSSSLTALTASTSEDDTDVSVSNPTNDGPNSADGSGDGPDDDGTIFDVGTVGEFCKFKDPGIYCDDSIAIECGPGGSEISTENCAPDSCLPGEGCIVCVAGQNTCMGDKVMVCNDAVDPPVWEVAATCDPSAGEGCDLAMGACVPLQPVGGVEPTGTYYQFAYFEKETSAFAGGTNVDSFGDKLYVTNYDNDIDVYEVDLLDSDEDGQLEPNQHPDNPAMPGDIEERVLTYVETIPSFGTPFWQTSEIFALDDRLYIGGEALTENVLGVGTSTVSMAPDWMIGVPAKGFSHIGYDDVSGVWYASNENERRVFQHCAATNTWGIAFLFPALAGEHMDGLEVVTDPTTGTPYVYVSDMTTDFLGQYRLDPEQGWVQENLFSYAGTAGAAVEGMGFGALNHFWATDVGDAVYEIGGGDLSDYTDPRG